jgi:ubiquinone/menaquinone biosynthesis C-methylase UbiE
VKRLLARQLSNPTGFVGRLVGRMMKLANREPTRIALEALAIQPGENVLDLGCGPGQATALMLPLAMPGMVTGIDQSSTMIGQAGRYNRHAVAAGHMAFRVATFEALPFNAASFDAVLASNVMYFWHDPCLVISEIRRVLRKDGRLSIYLTSEVSMKNWGFAEAGTHRLFSAEDVKAALLAGGFAEAEVSVCTVSVGKGVTGIVATARKRSSEAGILRAA